LQPLIDRLEHGETPGDRVKGTRYTVYKVRLQSADMSRGKSGGYRVIYYLKTADLIVLLAIYAKPRRADISPGEIRSIIENYESSSD
jgi:mRNA-degrading endonuclease RelE of RelBE toxin-antitoxin system